MMTASVENDPAGSVRVLLDPSRVVVELSGDIDAELGDDLLEAAAEVAEANLPVVVLAAPVTFMDSTGVAFLARAASRSPGRLRLVDPPELVRFLVHVTAIVSLLDVVDGDEVPRGDAGLVGAGAGERTGIVDPEPPADGTGTGAGPGLSRQG